jgi:hypothetical protein
MSQSIGSKRTQQETQGLGSEETAGAHVGNTRAGSSASRDRDIPTPFGTGSSAGSPALPVLAGAISGFLIYKALGTGSSAGRFRPQGTGSSAGSAVLSALVAAIGGFAIYKALGTGSSAG